MSKPKNGPIKSEGTVYVLTYAYVPQPDAAGEAIFDGVFADEDSAKWAAGLAKQLKWHRSWSDGCWASEVKHGVIFYIDREKVVRYTSKKDKHK